MTDGEDGFLTLEAIIALALAALVLSAFYQTASLAIQGRQAAAARQELLTLGQSLIERAGVDPAVLSISRVRCQEPCGPCRQSQSALRNRVVRASRSSRSMPRRRKGPHCSRSGPSSSSRGLAETYYQLVTSESSPLPPLWPSRPRL